MSGRDLHRFLVHHRTQAQDINEENHLVTRLFNGLDSDRYLKVDYEALKSMTTAYKTKDLKYKKKVNEIQSTAKLVHDKTLIKQHKMVWKNSMESFRKNLNTIEQSCANTISHFINRTKNYDTEFAEEFSNCVNDTDEDIGKLYKAVVEPIQEFKEDLAYRIRNNGCKSDKEEVLKQLETVKKQSNEVAMLFSHQREALEEDLAKIKVLKTDVQEMPPLGKSIPVEIVFADCPFDDVKNQVTRQFVDLHTQYTLRLQQETERKEMLENAMSSSERPLTTLEKWTVEQIHEIYELNTPEHLRKLNLEKDMLFRLLNNRSKLNIFNYISNFLKLGFAIKKRKEIVTLYYHNMEALFHKSLAVFADARAEYTILKNKGIEKEAQMRICDQLHNELNEMHERQAEIMRIEQILEDEAKQNQLEEIRKQKMFMEKRRSQIHKKVSEFQRQKQSQEELKRRENQLKLQQLYEQLKRQREHDKKRVEYRDNLYEQKLEIMAQQELKIKEEEALKLKRLDAIRSQVAVQAEHDPARLVQDTKSTKARLGIGVNDDVNLQQPLFAIHGYSDHQIGKDRRVRAEEQMRKAGLLNTQYAQQMLATLAPPTKPRPDNDSSAFKSTLDKF